MTQETDRLIALRPDTGEVDDLRAVDDDLALGMMLDECYEMERLWRERRHAIQAEIERRGKERGYNDGRRRVYAKRMSVERTVWEQIEGGAKA